MCSSDLQVFFTVYSPTFSPVIFILAFFVTIHTLCSTMVDVNKRNLPSNLYSSFFCRSPYLTSGSEWLSHCSQDFVDLKVRIWKRFHDIITLLRALVSNLIVGTKEKKTLWLLGTLWYLCHIRIVKINRAKRIIDSKSKIFSKHRYYFFWLGNPSFSSEGC